MTCTTSNARKTKRTRPRVGRSKPDMEMHVCSLSTLEAEQEEHYHNIQGSEGYKAQQSGWKKNKSWKADSVRAPAVQE